MQPLGAFLASHSQALGGQALVGRAVCLDWGEHNAGEDDEGPAGRGWYAGRLVAYDAASGEFTVRDEAVVHGAIGRGWGGFSSVACRSNVWVTGG
jgi:hypothetical protein